LGLLIAMSVDYGNHFVRNEGVGSLIVYLGHIVVDDGLRLDVKIAHHSIAMPSAHHPNDVKVNLPANHNHGAVAMKGAGDYLHGVYARLGVVHRHGAPQDVLDIIGVDGSV
jgi:hypothetical protein